MADYIYLLENRLSPAQRNALTSVREVARARSITLFLVGGAVRDLTSGSPVRDLDVVVLGNALKLKKELEKAGAVIDGEMEAGQALFLRFPGQVRMEVGSALSVTYPKPGKAVVKPATILEDLRRRDFTANAMALSLNEGSYGLLMDPLNGVADIENRELRLVSNYGFIEDPVRMIRAARLMARLGWTLEEKTQTRYQTGQHEGYISVLSDFHRGYETEEVFYEEDPLRVLKRLEADGWMKILAPFWTQAKVNVAELERLRDAHTQLQMHGISPDVSAAAFPLLTAKLAAKEVSALKSMFPRRGLVAEVDGLEAETRELATQLGSKQMALPSQSWRLLTSSRPEPVLQVLFSNKSAPVQAKFKSFLGEWPQARQKIPYSTMQEMRITPDLPSYAELLERLFFELMDGNLSTPEEMKAFLEPYSPPAPPPPVSMRRPRAGKAAAKPTKSRARKARAAEDDDADELEAGDESETASATGDDDGEELIDKLGDVEDSEDVEESEEPDSDLEKELDADDVDDDEDDSDEDEAEAPPVRKGKPAPAAVGMKAKPAAEKSKETGTKQESLPVSVKKQPEKTVAKKSAAKTAVASPKPNQVSAAMKGKAAVKASAGAAKVAAKSAVKAAAKAPAKAAVKAGTQSGTTGKSLKATKVKATRRS